MGSESPDRWGVPVRASRRDALELLDDGVEALVALSGDPEGMARSAVGADGTLLLGHALRAYCFLYAATPDGNAAAREILDGIGEAERETGEREKRHLKAARAWAAGDLFAAARALEGALLLHPRDLLALRVAQDLYFLIGDEVDFRDVAARVLPAWPRDEPGWGYVQGIYAFGLEESAEYPQAEERARAALHQHPGDVWAVHALTHVMEMEGRPQEGIAFLASSLPNWRDSYFAIHNWWHRGLFDLDVGELDDVVALYDGPIRASGSTVWLNLVDAASLLWRLALFGVDIGDRALALAGAIEPLIGEAIYLFNDWHAVMAFGLAGRRDLADRLIVSNRDGATGTNHAAVDGAGMDLLEGFVALAFGAPDLAVDRLVHVRPRARVVGGSNAQRHVIDLTLLAAAASSGNGALVRALIAEQTARKPSASASIERLVGGRAVRTFP